jgi:glycosyltransferase involved in cell wall biosynthesis
MRVLHVNSGNLFGGIEVLLVTLAKHRELCPAIEPEYALCFSGRTQEELAATGVDVHLLGAARVSRPWTIWQVRRRLRTLLSERHYDAVVCHGSWSLCMFAPVVRQARIPLVMWLHCPPAEPLHWLERWGSWNAPDLTICNSDYTLAGAERLFPNGRVRRIYYPLHFPYREISPDERLATRKQFDTAADAVIILQVGRWDPYKGHLFLMQALGLLRELPGWMCWQVGGVQNRAEENYIGTVRQAARAQGIEDRVRFLGFQDNQAALPRIMAAADVFCQPNVAPEPFGIVFIEALQSGMPVVTTALGGPLEIVDSSCGYLVPAGEPRMLADLLQRLVGDPDLRRRLGANGPARARAISEPAACMRELEGTLRELLGQLKQKAG